MTPDHEIGFATRVLQNMLDAGDIGTLPVDTEQRFRGALATLRAAQAEVAEMRADRPKRARKPDKWFQAITGQMQEVR